MRNLWGKWAHVAMAFFGTLALCSTLGAVAVPTASAAATPKRGGTVSIGGFDITVLDPAQVGYVIGGGGTSYQILGSLFDAPSKPNAPLEPDLALSGTFNAAKTAYTLHLRPKMKFSDGTPINAQAVIWNWQRQSVLSAVASQWMKYVATMKAVNSLTVRVTFTQPYSVFQDVLANEPLGNLASPSAFNTAGATQFSTNPVGAGPWMIQSVNPGELLTLVRNPHYWDAKHVYIDKIVYTNTGTDSLTQLNDLQSGAINVLALPETSTSPTVLATAKSLTSYDVRSTPATTVNIIPMNTYSAPFNDIRAREAVAYCFDKEAVATSTMAGFVSPAWTFSGPASTFYPTGSNGKPSIAAAKALDPFTYDPAKGTALVQQLGGLSFTVLTFRNQDTVVAEAMAQQWTQCGIKVNISQVQASVINPDLTNGTYQMIFTGVAEANPLLSTAFLDPTVSLGSHDFQDPMVSALVKTAFATTDPKTEEKIRAKIYHELDVQAEFIETITGGSLYLTSKCLKNVDYTTSNTTTTYFTHSWLSC